MKHKKMTKKRRKELEAEALEKLEAWLRMQSLHNTTSLYNVASILFGSEFDPREYDDVE